MTVDSRTRLERGSFRRLIKPLLEHDQSLTLKTTRWWVARARKYPVWLQEALAGLPDDQQVELRAFAQEAGHG